MTPTPMTRDLARTLHTEALAALEAVAAKHGLTVAGDGGTRYDPESGTVRFPVKFAMADSGEREYDRWRALYDLPPLGTTFTLRGRRFTITGYDAKRRTRPVLCRDETDGKTYIFTRVAARLNAAQANPGY